MHKEIPIVFHNRSNYDYYFIIEELVVEFEGQFASLGEYNEKYITFTFLIEEEVRRIDKKDLWQAHYQILLIILLNELIKLNVNVDTMIKKVD